MPRQERTYHLGDRCILRSYTEIMNKEKMITEPSLDHLLLFSFKGLHFMLFYANSLIIRFFFVSLQPKAASTGYASAI